MEEVDGIILHNLRAVGCDIDDGVVRVGEMSAELLVEAAGRCLNAINPHANIHYKLPPSMAARFRVSTDLANAVKEAGFKGSIGYQTFLYCNEIEVRRVLMFLIDRLPKDHTESSQSEPLGTQALLQKSVATIVSNCLSASWILPSLRTKKRNVLHSAHNWHSSWLSVPTALTDPQRKPSDEMVEYYRRGQTYVYTQARCRGDVLAALIENNSTWSSRQREWEREWGEHGLQSHLNQHEYRSRKRQRVAERISEQLKVSVAQSDRSSATRHLNSSSRENDTTKASRFKRVEKLQFAPDDEAVANQIGTSAGGGLNETGDEQAARGDRLRELGERLSEVCDSLDVMNKEINEFNSRICQIKEELSDCVRENEVKEKNYSVKKQTLQILPTAESNIAQLQSAVVLSEQRLVSLERQWDKHRVPLEQRLTELKELTAGRILETQRKIEEIRDMEERIKELTVESREKDELSKQLDVEYQRMTKDINRTAYTRRILEIVSNIRKQNQDIDKVLIDTKEVQKEINSLSGKLDRTFVVTDELIFKDAKKDEAARKAYKHLAALHENCSTLVKTIEETGSITREIRDLEDLVDSESKKKTDATLEQILADYQQMKRENNQLMNRIKQLRQQL